MTSRGNNSIKERISTIENYNNPIKSNPNHKTLVFSPSNSILILTLILSNNSSTFSPPSNPDSTTSSLQVVFISFVFIRLLFIALCSFRCVLQQREVRRASLLQKQANNGLNSALISSLPSFPYKRSENNGSSMECSICLSGVEEGEIVRVLPKCKHSFHDTCVELWLQGHRTCPVCRMEVLGEDRNVIIDPPRSVEMV